MSRRLLVPAVTLLLAGGAAAQEPSARPKSASPPELQKTLAKATVHNQRVLAVLATEGQLAADLRKNKVLSRPVLYEFETVQFTGDTAHALAVAWKMPDALAQRPALAVLDASGKVLGSLLPAQFLDAGVLQGEKLLEALKPFYCAPVDAETKLAASLAEAKKTGRAVFVRFDAPW